MPTFTAPDALLLANLRDTLARLRRERADGPPDHNTEKCGNCPICSSERLLNRYLEKIPRRENR